MFAVLFLLLLVVSAVAPYLGTTASDPRRAPAHPERDWSATLPFT